MSEERVSGWKVVGLTIEGFRRFQQGHTWSFRGPDGAPLDVIVFSGPSGSGKTSVLEALLIALGALAAPRGKGALVRVALERWRMKGEDYERMEEAREVSWSGGAKIEKIFGDKGVDYFSSWRAPLLSGGVRPKTSGKYKKNVDENRLFLLKEYIVSSLARSAIVKNSDSSKGVDALEKINAIWRSFAFSSFSTTSRIEAGEALNPGEGYDLFVVDGAKRVPVDLLSAGELELFQLASSFAFGLVDPHALLVVDEPELHLDQALQSAWLGVVRAATSTSTQLILATHSEEIWSRAYSYERFLLVSADDPRASFPAAHGGVIP